MILHFLFAPLLLAKFFGQRTSIKTNIVPGSLLEFSAPQKTFRWQVARVPLHPPPSIPPLAHSSYLVVLWSLAKETCAWKSEIAAEMSLKSTQRNTHPKMAINVCDSSSKLFSLSCGSSLQWGYSYSYSYSHSYWSLHSLAYPWPHPVAFAAYVSRIRYVRLASSLSLLSLLSIHCSSAPTDSDSTSWVHCHGSN